MLFRQRKELGPSKVTLPTPNEATFVPFGIIPAVRPLSRGKTKVNKHEKTEEEKSPLPRAQTALPGILVPLLPRGHSYSPAHVHLALLLFCLWGKNTDGVRSSTCAFNMRNGKSWDRCPTARGGQPPFSHCGQRQPEVAALRSFGVCPAP